MTVAYIAPVKGLKRPENSGDVMQIPDVDRTAAPTTVTFTTSTATASALSSDIVEIISTGNCHFFAAASPTATTSHHYLPAGERIYVAGVNGYKIAFIDAA